MKAATNTMSKLDALDKNVLGMALFLASEAVFFALLIIAFVTFRTGGGISSDSLKSLDPQVTGIFSIFLLSSSLTVWLADRSLERGSRKGLVGWLIVTIILGSIFLAGQGMEYARLLSQDITISRDLFGSSFFTLTGFHGLHVFIGLVMLAILAGLAATGTFRGRKSGALSSVSLYWHFVDAVWVIIFSIVYIGSQF